MAALDFDTILADKPWLGLLFILLITYFIRILLAADSCPFELLVLTVRAHSGARVSCMWASATIVSVCGLKLQVCEALSN
jgi:hypothetical protein